MVLWTKRDHTFWVMFKTVSPGWIKMMVGKYWTSTSRPVLISHGATKINFFSEEFLNQRAWVSANLLSVFHENVSPLSERYVTESVIPLDFRNLPIQKIRLLKPTWLLRMAENVTLSLGELLHNWCRKKRLAEIANFCRTFSQAYN